MPEKNKCETEKKETAEEKAEKEKDVWSEDQKNRRYYYDDAHGYEVYQPDETDEDD
ncbi:hypothetical protein BH20ACI4_BH20ACI4_19050 [soil metagenome]